MIKEQYIEANKYFKSLVKRKKRAYYDKLYESLRQAKDGRELWGAINSFKSKPANVKGNVGTKEWISHFKQLLNPLLLSGSVFYVLFYLCGTADNRRLS